jgi:hypothetical protein
MGTATGLAYRERIIALRTAGYTLQAISQELGLTYSNVRDICHRYRRAGAVGLTNQYARCGPSTRRCSPVVYRAALWLKRLHPRWGSPRLQAGLKTHYQEQTPSIRSLNRWSRQSNLIKPRSKVATPSVGASGAVHNIWQVDAKEHLSLSQGQVGCYLTVTDEKSGAWLASLVFPHKRICQVPLHPVRGGLIGLFRRWGKPGAMRVDNGQPLGSPTANTTSALALWLIGFDIDMIFNKPYCPQSGCKIFRPAGRISSRPLT